MTLFGTTVQSKSIIRGGRDATGPKYLDNSVQAENVQAVFVCLILVNNIVIECSCTRGHVDSNCTSARASYYQVTTINARLVDSHCAQLSSEGFSK